MDRRRRQDKQEEDLPHVRAAKEEILPGYEDYLVLLQERNRLLKKLRKKDKSQIDIERKEQGFSVYVNGPHKGAQQQHHARQAIPTNPPTARAPKTAGDYPRNPNILDNRALQEIARSEIERQKEAARARTAPSARERRRNWNVESVEIKTTKGERKVKAPDILSGRYEDDFEADNSDEIRSSESENSDDESSNRRRKPQGRKPPPPRESDMFDSSDSINSEEELHQKMSRVLEEDEDEDDIEIDASQFSKQTESSTRKPPTVNKKGRLLKNSDDDVGSEKLMLSMRELKQLRHSLAKNVKIRESLARNEDSEDEDFVPDASIPEVEEDLPTDDSASFDESPRRQIDLKKPDDTIVIEFGGAPVSNKKVERNLSAARRKNLDEGEYTSGMNRPSSEKSSRDHPKLSNRSQSAKTLVASEKKAVRPLSANRRTPDRSSTDTDYEALAVMAALKEENEKAGKYNNEDKQASKVKPSPKVARENLVKPLYDKSEMPPRSHQMRQSESPRNSVGGPLVSKEKIDQIMQKVLKMNPKQQKRLVKMLGSIEHSLVDENKDVQEDKQLTPRRSVNKPVKATRTSLVKNSMAGISSTDPNILEVYIEIKSNWGHSMRLGLTEIQLYDTDKNPVPVSPSEVSVFGAEDIQGTTDLLFNGKFKTNKERNMWSCRYHARRPVELTIIARNPSPGRKDKFALGMIKIWNFNKSINDLEIGVKDIRVFVGSDLVYNGPVDKGCGNQVFDYCHVISIKPEPSSRDLEAEAQQSAAKLQQKQSVQTNKASAVNNRKQPVKDTRKENNRNLKNLNNGAHIETSKAADKVKSNRPPVSPRIERSPSPAPRLGVDCASPRGPRSSYHRSISPSPKQGEKKTFRSISMSSQSSASSGGDSRPSSGLVASTDKDKQIRSETRTLSYPKVKKEDQPMKESSDSLSESEGTPRDGPTHGSTPARRRGSKTPKKSKRMAARLDGHTSSDIDNSRSITDSVENRPPVPHRRSEEKLLTPRNSEEKMPPRKLESKVSRKALVQKSLEDKSNKPNDIAKTGKPVKGQVSTAREKNADQESEVEDSMRVPGNATSSSVSVTSSQDDMPMLQKLKDMNKKEQTIPRKKDVPRWLKQEDINAPFENPPDSRCGRREEQSQEESRVQQPPPTQEEINMLIDEELSLFPDAKKEKEVQDEESREGSNTPMQRIQKNRSKWRENPSLTLEESWGSLSQFNKNQRGRLSLDMDDDVLDEYINKAAKLAGLPIEPTIPEEGQEELPVNMSVDSDDDGFVIPELPYGKELVINIRTTWGDNHYVGLTGIEVFSSTGEHMTITKIRADPSDINILPDYNKDPRVVKNLCDGVNRTRDDIHMWLAPFIKGKDHLVFVTLEKPCKIALLRIWNYNKSRIHSYRGAKDVVIMLDSSVIFKGEIARACGGVEGGTEAFGDTMLFTMDEAILDAVSQNDEAYEGEMLSDDVPFDVERPSTAEGEGGGADRPFTRAVGNINEMQREATNMSIAPEYEGDILVYKGSCLELNFTATWGDQHYLGLTGLEVVGKDGEALPVSLETMIANPADVRGLQGHERDDRTLDKLINGNNVTVSDEHMWLIPFTEGNNHTLTINFGQKVLMAGLRLWNYNKSKEDTYRGARMVHVTIDRKVISPPEGYLVRKGPGNCHFDYAQEISFSPDANRNIAGLSAMGPSTDESQNYDFVQMPCGFIYQLQLFSTWGDVYYVGLNGLEFYDANLQQIPLTESNISAYPDSINVLENIQNDARTPDKLIDGVNDTSDGAHTWLAPILPSILNRVYVIFDQPTTISMIKLWNYSKTANRGAKDFAFIVDDLLVYNGVLQPVTSGARGILPTVAGAQPHHTILFTNNTDIIRKEKHNVISNQTGEQDVQMTNDKKIVSHYNDPKKAQSGKPVDQTKRPTTSIIHSKKRR